MYYPYTDIVSRFPRDYIWMYPAMLMLVLFVILAACVYLSAPDGKKIFGIIGFSFALTSSAILLTDYFIQVTVIQPSLLSGETDAVAMLTQYSIHRAGGTGLPYNERIIPVPRLRNGKGTQARQGRPRRFHLRLCSYFLSLALISAIYGIHREYIFEITAISIEWLSLIVSGILLGVSFARG